MSQTCLSDLARNSVLGCPISETASKSMRNRASVVFTQQFAQRAVSQSLPARRREYQPRIFAYRFRFFQNGQRGISQWDTMFTTGLHSLRRYYPLPLVQVDFIPCGVPNLPAPCCRKGSKTQKPTSFQAMHDSCALCPTRVQLRYAEGPVGDGVGSEPGQRRSDHFSFGCDMVITLVIMITQRLHDIDLPV